MAWTEHLVSPVLGAAPAPRNPPTQAGRKAQLRHELWRSTARAHRPCQCRPAGPRWEAVLLQFADPGVVMDPVRQCAPGDDSARAPSRRDRAVPASRRPPELSVPQQPPRGYPIGAGGECGGPHSRRAPGCRCLSAPGNWSLNHRNVRPPHAGPVAEYDSPGGGRGPYGGGGGYGYGSPMHSAGFGEDRCKGPRTTEQRALATGASCPPSWALSED
jgi:hypothetical protein